MFDTKPQKALIFMTGFLFLCLTTACNQWKADRGIIVSQVKDISELATVEYTVSKVILSAKKGTLSIGTATFMAESEATITAGIDMNKLSAEDIIIHEKQITLKLPAIEIINFSYPAEKFKPIDRYIENSFWTKITVEDKEELYRQAQSAIMNQIQLIGIKETAEKNTRKLLVPILERSGFEEIYIHFKEQ